MRNVNLAGVLLGEQDVVTLAQVCRVCRTQEQAILELVAEGIAEPMASEAGQWRFDQHGVRRLHIAVRLQRDLGVNPAGAALALQLMEEIHHLKTHGRRL